MNFSEIKETALTYVDSQDPELINAIPALMSIVEARLNKRFSVQKQIIKLDIPYKLNIQEYPLPDDFLSMSNIETILFYSTPIAPLPDTTVPTQPGTPVVAKIDSTKLFISWDASTDDKGIAGYDIFRDGAKINTLLIPTISYTDENLTPSTLYSYTVNAHDASGNVSIMSLSGQGTTDPLPVQTSPTAPGNLVGTVISPTQINYTWNASSDVKSITEYRLFVNSALVATLTASELFFNHTGLIEDTTYSAYVVAINSANIISPPSNTFIAKTFVVPDTTAPTVPTGFITTTLGVTNISLQWNASTDAQSPLIYYILSRDGVRISSETYTQTTYSDTGLSANTTYNYSLVAKDQSGNASAAASTSGKTAIAADTTAPTAPSNLVGTVISPVEIDYTWTASTDAVGVVAYEVWRNGVFVRDISPTATNYASISLTAGTQYSVYLIARDAAGNKSTASNTVTLTTFADLPDLVGVGLTVTADSTWTVSVVNQGAAVINSGLDVNVYVDNAYWAWIPFSTRDWPLNVTQTVTVNSGSAITPGSHTLKMDVDPANTIPENNNSNNIYSVVYNVPGSTDVTAPTVPTGLTASSVSSSQINISWSASTDAVGVAGYRLYDNAVQVGADITGLTYSHTGLVSGSTHTYQVLAFDTAGNASAKSAAVQATTTSVVNAIYIATTGNDSTGNGTIGNPYKTITATLGKVSAGKTVYIRGGTYNEKITWWSQHSGTAASPITWAGYPGETAIISGATLPQVIYDGLIQMNGVSYVNFDNLTLNDSKAYAFRGELNPHHINITNCKTNRSLNSAVSFLACTDIKVSNNNFREMSKRPTSGVQEGISFNSGSNITVNNNIIYDCEIESIDLKNAISNANVYNNDISLGSGSIGIYIDAFSSAVNGVNIYNNVVRDNISKFDRYPGSINWGSGIALGAEQGGTLTNINVYNNVVDQWSDHGITVQHWKANGGAVTNVYTNISIFNNTLNKTNYLSTNSDPHSAIWIGVPGPYSNLRIANNIIANTVAPGTNMFIDPAITPTLNTNNLFFGGTTKGNAPVIGDPKFVTPDSNFALQANSPAINAGTSVAGVPTTDITGKTRTGLPDIGAYEF
jgi:chitodextrinase